MNRKISSLAAGVLFVLLAASCSDWPPKPNVEIKVNPERLDSPGLVAVTWKTQDYSATTISSNPPVSGLPKSLTGDASATDNFNVTATTTFEIKGETKGQYGPIVKIASATVSVGN